MNFLLHGVHIIFRHHRDRVHSLDLLVVTVILLVLILISSNSIRVIHLLLLLLINGDLWETRELLVGIRVGSLAPEPFAKVGVPVVLDFVIGSTREPTRDERPPVAQKRMQSYDKVVLIRRDVASLDIWPQIVHPS